LSPPLLLIVVVWELLVYYLWTL